MGKLICEITMSQCLETKNRILMRVPARLKAKTYHNVCAHLEISLKIKIEVKIN